MTMNVIAIMNHMGVYFKEEPIRELHRALEGLNFRIVYPNDREDLLKLTENSLLRVCAGRSGRHRGENPPEHRRIHRYHSATADQSAVQIRA